MSDYYFLNECKELKRLIAEYPDLPLMFYSESEDCYYSDFVVSNSRVRAYKEKILDCPNEVNDEFVFDDKEYFEEELQEMLCGMDEYRNLSDEEFYEIFRQEKSKYDDKWKDCIIVYVGN